MKTTIKQTRFVKLLGEALSNPNNRQTLGQLMAQAGYSPSMCETPIAVLKCPNVQEGLKPFMKRIDEKRKKALSSITDKKLVKSTAKDSAHIFDILTKNYQLLGGNATERIAITDKEKKEIDDVFDKIEE